VANQGLVTFAREALLERIAAAEKRVWLASPFLTAPVATRIRDAIADSSAGDRRLLTALVPRSVQVGVLSPKALALLQGCDFEVRSIPNLHAKACLVDDSWGLVGSGNLTGSGLGGEEGGNVELGVLLDRDQRQAAAQLFSEWWVKKAGQVTADDVAIYAQMTKLPPPPPDLPQPGDPLELASPSSLASLLEDEGPAERGYWIKSNYHRPGEEDWWHRGWVSDWRQAPYKEGDLIVLYLSARDGGPACCPAVVRVTHPSTFDRDWVLTHRDPEAAERWPYVTRVAVVGEVPVPQGAPLSTIGKNGQSVQAGYCGISRAEFESLVEAMLS
jgi:phospholipase D-like protein